MKPTGFNTQIRTKNFTSAPLRGEIGRFPVRSIVRLGSRTPNSKAFPKALPTSKIIEINTVQSIENSRSKLLMKTCFAQAKVPQSDWYNYIFANGEHRFQDNLSEEEHVYRTNNIPYPILAKRICGFKGHGMAKLDNQVELEEWLKNNSTSGYYFEQFVNYAREYRLHCTQDSCFMVWRKLRKADADNRWFFNSSNCNWVGENHNLFDRPSNFNAVVADCLKAIKAVGLEVGSFDVRIQSNKQRNPAYILVEVNSAPSLGEQGVEIYKNIIKDLITKKI